MDESILKTQVKFIIFIHFVSVSDSIEQTDPTKGPLGKFLVHLTSSSVLVGAISHCGGGGG